MTLQAVVGINWGDEGKGRMVDYLAESADVVVRYQGGNNAGHTVLNELGLFKLNLIPAGIFNPRTINVLGPGMVIDVQSLHEELGKLESAGVSTNLVRVSSRATVCFPFNRIEDAAEEVRLGDKPFGSTQRGIAPAYGDRHLKKSLQVGELLLGRDELKRRLAPIVEWKNRVLEALYDVPPVELEEMVTWSDEYGQKLAPLIGDVGPLLHDAAAAGKLVIFEAQLGALRDIYYGIYPYTSSSCSLAPFGPIGAGCPGLQLTKVMGVMKAFSTSIGEGPFVTEMRGEIADALRETADEYGAATGRPRRIGHFDAVASAYGVQVQGATELALTKLDSLSNQTELKICTAYSYDGEQHRTFPLNGDLERAAPVYEVHEGWSEDIQGVRDFTDLPAAAIKYVLAIEQLVGCYIRFISVGPERTQLIDRGQLRTTVRA
ncbi:MAG: adenylosuccinate synthase [Actinomycetota bacterium]|nr:adenylosuccinate synthase [Actinomycetota bacterium]